MYVCDSIIKLFIIHENLFLTYISGEEHFQFLEKCLWETKTPRVKAAAFSVSSVSGEEPMGDEDA